MLNYSVFEEKAQSYRVKDKEIYRVKLARQNTKVYRVNTQLTKGTITLLYFFCFFFAYAHAKRVRQVSCERVRTVPCACDHLIHCFPVEGHILLKHLYLKTMVLHKGIFNIILSEVCHPIYQ